MSMKDPCDYCHPINVRDISKSTISPIKGQDVFLGIDEKKVISLVVNTIEGDTYLLAIKHCPMCGKTLKKGTTQMNKKPSVKTPAHTCTVDLKYNVDRNGVATTEINSTFDGDGVDAGIVVARVIMSLGVHEQGEEMIDLVIDAAKAYVRHIIGKE